MPAEELPAKENAQNNQLDGMILNCLIATLGFGLCRGWIVYCLAAPLNQETLYMTNWVYLICGALAALCIFLIVRRYKESIQRFHYLLFWIAGGALVLSAVLIPLAIAYHWEALLFCGFVIGGIGAGVLQVLWGDRFAFYRTRFATIVSPAAAIVTALLVASTAPASNLIGYVAFPLLSFALLLLLTSRTGISLSVLLKREVNAGEDQDKCAIPESVIKRDQDKKEESLGGDVVKLMISIMVFSFLCRAFDAAPRNGADPFAFVGGSALMSLIIVGAVFLLFVAILRNRFNPVMTYRLSLPIMVAGFIALALLFETHVALSILLINIGYEFFDILAWILFTDISRRKGSQPLKVFGLGVFSMFTGMVLGLICGEVMQIFIESGQVQINVIAMLSILSLVIVAFLVIPEGTVQHLTRAISSDKTTVSDLALEQDEEDASEENAEKPNGEGRLECNCTLVAEEYKLTPRESEVLVLLAYGRTLAIIARDLQIANGTARTHIENIYRKLDVHKQQELIDLVEDYT